jgi:hypothetical protein
VERLRDGLWRWTARHPEWHPGEFGAEVASFAARAGDTTLLIDPLLPEGEAEAPEPGPALSAIDAIVGDRLAILITIPYHVRSAEELRERYGATIHGHRAVAKRLGSTSRFHEFEAGAELPGGVSAYPIGKPRQRYETPLHLPSHRALVFGDSVVEQGGALRVWAHDRVDEKVRSFYADRFNPTLEPLLELDFDAVLVTHGEPVMSGGREQLRKALDAEPWYHHG